MRRERERERERMRDNPQQKTENVTERKKERKKEKKKNRTKSMRKEGIGNKRELDQKTERNLAEQSCLAQKGFPNCQTLEIVNKFVVVEKFG